MDFSGWEKLSLVDFDDNITTTLFMAGCPFRCPFCHNSDLVLRPNQCATIPWSEIMEYLKKRKGVLDAVCVSGGEPTLMPDLKEKLKDIKSLGYLVKLDSNGCHPDVLKDLVKEKLVDYIAMDIKNSPARYEETCGTSIDFETIKESVSFLMTSGVRYEFRTTIIDEFHSGEDMLAIGKWIKGAERYFLQRYIDNENCIKNGLHGVSLARTKEFLDILHETVPNARLRGYDDN